MSWSLAAEVTIVMAVYLLVDRSVFWTMSNTFTQVSGRDTDLRYADLAFPRLALAMLGCLLTVLGKAMQSDVAAVAGLVTILVAMGIMCLKFVREFWLRRDA